MSGEVVTMDPSILNHRERSILRAVSAGRAELLAGCEPDLAIDGGWCDHAAVSRLLSGGWIRAARPAAIGDLVPARLTDAAYDVFTAQWLRSA
jgi:hypothetical protein